jgi:hypothetical protein
MGKDEIKQRQVLSKMRAYCGSCTKFCGACDLFEQTTGVVCASKGRGYHDPHFEGEGPCINHALISVDTVKKFKLLVPPPAVAA